MKLRRLRFCVTFGIVFLFALHFHSFSVADDQISDKCIEVPFSIKGLTIGMDVNDARDKMAPR